MKKVKYLKKIQFLCLLFLSIVCFTCIGTSIYAVEDDTSVSSQDLLKLAEGLNMSTDSEAYKFGTNPYDIFNHKSEGFSDLFVSSKVTNFANYSMSGTSRSEISSEYGRKKAFGADVDAKVPVYNVSANIDTNFETSIATDLQTINEEYYEYFERYQQTRVITTDWLSKDLTSFFSESFVNDLNAVNTINKATAFLEKYGTHVFDSYYMGGSLIITNYIVSEVSISEEYESNNKTIGLEAHISSAVDANTSGSDYSIEGNNVSNEKTKSKMDMRANGGMNLNALTVDDLFTYKQEYFTGGGSGYIYADWIKSLDSNQNEVVINAKNPVKIWDLLEKSSYYDSQRNSLFEQAFDLMCYGNYSVLCNENGINSNIIGKVGYDCNGVNVNFDITSDSINLPENTTANFELGNIITQNYNTEEIIVELDTKYSYATMNDNKLTLDSSAVGKMVYVIVKVHNQEIYRLKVYIKDNQSSFKNGYGTVDQPYLISSNDEWNYFLNDKTNFNKKIYYKLTNDLNLKGKLYEVGGSSERSAFKSELDGDGHTVYNFSVIAKSEWSNIGLIGINIGTIKNLVIKDARCMNSGIVQTTNGEINAGILVGENQGTIDNVQIINSSIKISGQTIDGSMNVGSLAGMNKGSISNVGVTNCNVNGQTWKGNGTINVGGLVGKVKVSTINNSYVRMSNINASNQLSDIATYTLGGIVGLVYSDENGTSKLENCIAYDNDFNKTSGVFGYISGNSTANNSFNNCFYQSSLEKSVNGKSMNGCMPYRKLTLSNIGNAEFNSYWTTDENGIILKKHEVIA